MELSQSGMRSGSCGSFQTLKSWPQGPSPAHFCQKKVAFSLECVFKTPTNTESLLVPAFCSICAILCCTYDVFGAVSRYSEGDIV